MSKQLLFPLQKQPIDDRNFQEGGRSFYFFDFDDNVMCLETEIFIFHTKTGEELNLSTREFGKISHLIGAPGDYEEYFVDNNDETGSFRRFRDLPKRTSDEQMFLEDLHTALQNPEHLWKGPSWEIFSHAVYNNRPLSIITARGHAPNTIRRGIFELVRLGLLEREPNYLSVFPVSHPTTRDFLDQERVGYNIAELKKIAIYHSFNIAMERYGHSPFHRFGMSDDSP